MNGRFLAGFAPAFVLLAAWAVAPATADTLTDASRAVLKAEKIDPALMSGLDKELAVPAALVAAATKEGELRVRLQMHEREFAGVAKVFNARYPGIELKYSRGIGKERAVGPLIAYKNGTFVAEVLSAYESLLSEWRKLDGLTKISDLPAYGSLRKEIQTKEGTDAGDKLNHWCMIYSPERVNKADLPKRWDDLLTNPRWKGGKVGIAHNAGIIWYTPLMAELGETWGTNFLAKLFNEVKPQLRKETLAAFGKLVAVGEFDLGFGVADYIVERDARKGVPVASHCPDPIPTTWGYLGIPKGGPHPNAAKLFLNWYISKEGQLANYHYARQLPVHGGLEVKELLPYPEVVMGKKKAYRTAEVLEKVAGKAVKQWEEHWAAIQPPTN
jgi:iron(III) transport system substrate-binding protein